MADAVVAYRWHAWFGLRVHVHEVLKRGDGACARCTLEAAPPGRSQELPLWMLDAATCEPMRGAESPVASAAALGALRALLSEAQAWSAASGEAPRGGGIGFAIAMREIAMPRPPRRPPCPQLELFLKTPARPAPGAPSWTSLPEPTRLALTGLMTRMLIAHAGDGPLAPEGDGDDE